ncbi:MAG: MGMT family protein [Pirellulaceae bacterium]|nr:MGMT family protein [Planctomycetales bacterium]MCA9206067.1 MGMT family protein [Planctomycetales bacterium]MCA9220429.1 MGMT family protein [Planctomycetales bacterium]
MSVEVKKFPPRTAVIETALGWIAFAWRDTELQRLTLGYSDPQAAHDALELTETEAYGRSRFATDLTERLQRYADGQREDFFMVKVNTDHLSPFQLQVIERCRQIPRGRTLTYRELATRSGSPNAARAVGNVMRTNRYPLIIPCHRVVASNGNLGGYSAPTGLELKKRLLDLEQDL